MPSSHSKTALCKHQQTSQQNNRKPCSATRKLGSLAISALGIIYGDIGTSPLYAIKECFSKVHGLQPVVPNILGILSLVFWSLILVVGLKYVVFIMQADNRGEGGIFSLLSLLQNSCIAKINGNCSPYWRPSVRPCFMVMVSLPQPFLSSPQLRG